MKKIISSIITVLLIFLNFSCSREKQEGLYTFNNIPDRIWVGEDFWTVPLEGWRVRDGRVVCVSDNQQATLSNLTHVLEEGNLAFNVRFDMGLQERGENDGSSGVIIGSEALEEKDVRAAVYFGQGIQLGVNTEGYAYLKQQTKQLPSGFDFNKFTIVVNGSRSSYGYKLEMNVVDETGKVVVELSTCPESSVTGIIQFVNNFRTMQSANNGPKFWFDNIHFEGPGFSREERNRFGPVFWTMYTLNRNTLKLTAMLPPISDSENQEAQFQVKHGKEWRTLGTGRMDADARTVMWKLENWNPDIEHEYRVLFDYVNSLGDIHVADYGGTIRRDPVDKPLRFGLLTCQFWRAFPYSPLVRNLELSSPDILYFSGDQIYEPNGGYSHVRWPEDKAILNYLGKYYMFGWAFGELMRNIPTIVTPDDHDVYHGNLWGEGGMPVENQHLIKKGHEIDTGSMTGFIQTARWLNMMHRTQVAHLPDPYDATPIEQGISVWYTSLNYGRVSFAIVSDRYFKSAPERVSRWREDPSLIDMPGLQLLGERQEMFLEKWVRDWNNVGMKAVLSQTPFAALATHHGGNYSISYRGRGDIDSGGWPTSARDRAIRIMRKGYAFHANGDQHLASIVQYGIDNYRDAGYGFCPPAISKGFPRWFHPDDLDIPIRNRPAHGLPNTGEYRDPLGNLNYIYAVGNPPEKFSRVANRYKNKQYNASGYGMVIFDNDVRTITMECWRFIADVSNPKPGDQFPGWPHTISQFDNYGREAHAWLPTLKIDGYPDPVVEVINQETGELEYSVRIKGKEFAPKVFSNDIFTIRLGYPERNTWKVIEDVIPLININQEELAITL